MMPRTILIVLVALLLLPRESRAEAPPSLRETLSAEAGAKFDEGTRLYKASEFDAAREAFLAAYAKSGDHRLLYNVAVCDKALGRYARAIGTLKTSLAAPQQTLPAEYAQRVAESIATLSRYVAFVDIHASVDGATFTLDGESLRETPVAVDTGVHTIVASKDGYDPISKTITVTAGEPQEITFELVESHTPGSATISCVSPLPCEVTLDDLSLGRAPVTVTRSAGTYVVRASTEGRRFDERTIEFRNGKALAVTLSGRSMPMSRLRLSTDHADDTVTIDGKRVGRSGLDVEIDPGEHHIMIARPGGPSRSLDVLLRPNETRDLRVSLDEKKSGPSPWWFVGGGLLAAGTVTLGIFLATRPTTFEGNAAGTLNPYVVPASAHGVLR